MNNYGFLKKSELSYILNKKTEFDEFTLNQIAEYCDYRGWNIEKIKAKKPTWEDEIGVSLNFESDESKIVISETLKSKKANLYSHIFVLIALIIILIGSLYFVFFDAFKTDFERIACFFGIPFVFIFLITIFKKVKLLKDDLGKILIYQIFKKQELIEINDGNIQSKGKIQAINLFWNETDDSPDGLLELKMKNGEKIVLKEYGSAMELFQIGLKISNFLGMKLLIFIK